MDKPLIFAALAAALVVPVALGSAGAQSGNLYGRNLVVNGEAEADVGAPDNGKIVKPSDWSTTGQFTAVQYGASGGFPNKTSPGPPDRGANLFEGGNVARSTATQTISLAPAASDIAAGKVTYVLKAWLGGYSSQDDNAKLTLIFRNASGRAVAQTQLGPVLAATRKGVTGLLPRSASGDVPKGAVNAVITVQLTRAEGTYNDGSVDNISLVLSKSS